MKELESKLLWQKIYLNSAYGVSPKEFQDFYENRFQTKERLATIKRRVTKLKKIFNEQI